MKRMQELGMAGLAGDYEALSLEEMAERYRSGVTPSAA
jgi:adenine deaminase